MSFVVIARDAEGSLGRRPALRAAHLEYWKRLEDAGRMVLAGPLGNGQGSLFVIEAESAAEAEELIQGDPYSTGGVFASWEVLAFQCVLPLSRYGPPRRPNE